MMLIARSAAAPNSGGRPPNSALSHRGNCRSLVLMVWDYALGPLGMVSLTSRSRFGPKV